MHHAPYSRVHGYMPQILHSEEAQKLGGEQISHYLNIVRLLLKEPYLTGKAVCKLLDISEGSIHKPLYAARKTLGIVLDGDLVKLVDGKALRAARGLGVEPLPFTEYSRKYGSPQLQTEVQDPLPTPPKLGDTLNDLCSRLRKIMEQENITELVLTKDEARVSRVTTVTEHLKL